MVAVYWWNHVKTDKKAVGSIEFPRPPARSSQLAAEMVLDAVAKNQGSSTHPEKEEGANRTSKRALAS